MSKKLIEEFVEMALSDTQQFTITKGKNPKYHTFIKVAVNNAVCVYGAYGYYNSDFLAEIDVKFIPYAIVSGGEVYTIQKFDLGLTGAQRSDYPPRSQGLDEFTARLNQEVNDVLFHSFYTSLPIRELTDDEVQNANNRVRSVILENAGENHPPTVGDLINNQKSAHILYGILDFEEYVHSVFAGKRENYIRLKSINATIDKLASELKGVEAWEIKLNTALRELDAKAVTVEFEYNNHVVTDKFERVRILNKLSSKDYFSSYDFPTEKSGKEKLNQIGAGNSMWSDSPPLTCEHITKITYGKKVIYSK